MRPSRCVRRIRSGPPAVYRMSAWPDCHSSTASNVAAVSARYCAVVEMSTLPSSAEVLCATLPGRGFLQLICAIRNMLAYRSLAGNSHSLALRMATASRARWMPERSNPSSDIARAALFLECAPRSCRAQDSCSWFRIVSAESARVYSQQPRAKAGKTFAKKWN